MARLTFNTSGACASILALFAMLLASGAAAHPALPASGIDYDAALTKSQRAIGMRVGDHVFVDTQHRRVSLSQYRGKPLVVSLVYTGCTDICRTTTQFVAQAVSAARAAFGEEHFNVITIGFNQPFDSPEAMAAFARQQGVRDNTWAFLSTDAKTIEALAADLGFTYYTSGKGIDHLSQITILDREGAVYRQVYGDAFEVRAITAPLKELLAGEARAAGFAGVWDKVKLFCTVYDPRTGRYRANYSLFVEIFAGATILVGIAWFLIAERRRAGR